MTTSGQTMGLRGNTPNFEYITAKKPVISGSGSTRSLIDAESNMVVLADKVGGTTFKLPVGVPGQEFTFITNIATSSFSIVTNIGTSTPIIVGNIAITPVSNLSNGSMFVATGADQMVKIATNGTTKGGLQGSKIVLTNLSSGTWFVSGTLIGSGTTVTPFSATP